MSSHSVGRKVRDLNEARRLLKQWRTSGQPLADWCRFHQINVHSLAAHKKNLERNAKPTAAVIDFVEVKLLPPPKTPAAYQIDLANGHTIRELFDIERVSDDADESAEERLSRRRRESFSVLARFESWMAEIQARYLPSEDMFKAIQYCRRVT